MVFMIKISTCAFNENKNIIISQQLCRSALFSNIKTHLIQNTNSTQCFEYTGTT